MLVLVFFLACGLYYFEKDGQPHKFSSIFDAMYFIFLNLTTVGFVDMAPRTLGGQLICSATVAIGFLITVAFYIGILVGTLKFVTFLRKV